LNWNVRLSRSFPVRCGRLRLALDLFNVTNENNSIQQSDISGPFFNQRLPIVIEPPRFFRFEIQYHF
jgi:hypothetical protein